jgi:hypothetical protein
MASLLASVVHGSPALPFNRESGGQQPQQTLTFTEYENDGACFVKLDNILGCSGVTTYPIGEFIDGRCTKCNLSTSLSSILPANPHIAVGASSDNAPSSTVPVCNRNLMVTWSKDVWGTHQATLKYPKTDNEGERMQITGFNSYARGSVNVVTVTEPLPVW